LSEPAPGPLRQPRPTRPAGWSRATSARPFAVALAVAVLLVASGGAATPVSAFGSGSLGSPGRGPGAPIVFYGRGYGHGVGMSQYGARGRAAAGQDAATILAHYYQGTGLGTTDPGRPIRILVLKGYRPTAARPLRLYGRGGSWTIDGIATTFPKDAQLRVTTTSTGFRVVVLSASGATLLARTTKGSLRIRAGTAGAARIQVWSKPSAYDRYRGVIRLHATASGIDVINEVALDTYLRGVVPAEMPASWPVEALRAQAIAARSYAARRLHPATGFWDVYDDTRSQVYHGSLGEQPTTDAVIADTAGRVVTSGSSIANTLFHSTGGGATEDNENVFTSATGRIISAPVSYLRGSPDRADDGTPYDASSPRETWQTAPHTLAELSTIFGADDRTNTGELTALDLSNVGVSGRLISVTLIGSLGTRTVSGEVFRSVFNAHTPATDPYMWSTLVSTRPIP
jgi:SpoIID/LytB domain protein